MVTNQQHYQPTSYSDGGAIPLVASNSNNNGLLTAVGVSSDQNQMHRATMEVPSNQLIDIIVMSQFFVNSFMNFFLMS